METRHATLHGLDADVVHAAARDLVRGAIVGLPTECVYGLAVNGDDPAAVERLFAVKRRPVHRPIARILSDPAEMADAAPALSRIAHRLATRLWPGPLTLVLPDGAGGFAGFRVPDHDVARTFVAAAGVPVLATSANRSGRPDALDAADVRREFDGRIEWILDAGPARLGRASTVVKVDSGRHEILREGAIPAATITEAACLRVLMVCTGNVCRSPLAEGILRRLLADRLGCEPDVDELARRGFRVTSAGTAGLDASPATPEASAAAREIGVDISTHSSRPLTYGILEASDLVLVMTGSQHLTLARFAPEIADRVRLVDPAGEDVPDPFGQPLEEYRRTAARLREALGPIAEEMT